MRSLVAIDRIIFVSARCSANRLLLQQAGTPRGEISTKTLGNWLMPVHGRVLVTIIRRRGKQ
jgi:hypothetical protein